MMQRIEMLQLAAVLTLALLAAIASFNPGGRSLSQPVVPDDSRFTADGWRAAL